MEYTEAKEEAEIFSSFICADVCGQPGVSKPAEVQGS
jgi:hypothetical protein